MAIEELTPRRVYLDTNVLIYALEQIDPWAKAASEILAQIDAGTMHGITSELTLAECLVKPLQLGRDDLHALYLVALRDRPTFTIWPVDRAVLVASASLRTRTNLRLADAIHAATAEISGCESIISNDPHLKAGTSLPVVSLK